MVGAASCRATRRDGAACQAVAVLPSGWCAMHDPSRQAEMQAARAEGGRQRSRIARVERLVPGTLRPVLALLLDVLADARDGTIAPAQANAVAAVAGAIVKVYSSATVEERIADLEEQIATLTRRGA